MTAMHDSTVDAAEVARFAQLASEWWDPRGKMAVLHKFNPVRLGFISAAFAQGLMLGAIVEGLPLQDGKYLGGAFSWFSPFSMLTAVALVFGYALLGSTWLILKTEGPLQNIVYALTRPLVAVVVAFMGLVSTWLPFLSSQIMRRWFDSGNFIWLSPVPLLALINAVLLWQAVMRHREAAPFILALCFFGLGFAG